MKTALKIFLILIVAGFLIWSFIGLDNKADDRVCTGMTLDVEDSLSLGLINKDEVLDIMKKKKIDFTGKKIANINMGNVERTLRESPYIDSVSCSINAGGMVNLTIIPKIPALHVMASNGEEYYLDRRGSDMPVGNLSGNLSVATGNITKEFARTKLAPLAACIQDSTFWRAQVQQIEVINAHDVRLYTRIADHVILLGEPDNIPEKLWKLRVFYSKGLPATGWDKYETINVAYTDIIIGKKKE